jgi:hypothetical protein
MFRNPNLIHKANKDWPHLDKIFTSISLPLRGGVEIEPELGG